jgi:hypothetical protein
MWYAERVRTETAQSRFFVCCPRRHTAASYIFGASQRCLLNHNTKANEDGRTLCRSSFTMPSSKEIRAERNRRYQIKITPNAPGNCQLCGLYEARRSRYEGRALCKHCFSYATMKKKTQTLALAVEERRELFRNIARSEDAEAAYAAEREASKGAPDGYPLDSSTLLVLYVSRYAYVTDDFGARTHIKDVLRMVNDQARFVLADCGEKRRRLKTRRKS